MIKCTHQALLAVRCSTDVRVVRATHVGYQRRAFVVGIERRPAIGADCVRIGVGVLGLDLIKQALALDLVMLQRQQEPEGAGAFITLV